MKYLTNLITMAALACSMNDAIAETPLERELTALQAQHTKALAAASEPVNRRQIAALEMLQRRAMQANDLETATKIKAELAKLTGASASGNSAQVPGADGLAKRLVGTKWVWFQKETVTFRANGKMEWSRNREAWSWKVENADQRVISGVAVGIGKKFTMTFDSELMTGAISGEDGDRKTRNVTKEP